MTAPTKAISEGLTYAGLGYYNSSGILTGGTPTAPANGAAASDFAEILGARTMAPTTPDPETVQITAEELLGEFTLPSTASRAFVAELAALDMTMIDNIQNTLSYALAGARFAAEDIEDVPETDTCLIINARTKKQDVGVKGKKAWSGAVIPVATAKWLGRDSYNARNGASYRLSLNPQSADQAPWGITMQDILGTPGARRLPFTGDYPYWLASARGDGSTPTFVVRHRPVSAALAAAIVIPPPYATGGAAVAVASVNRTAPYSITLGSNPATGAAICLLYAFDSFTRS